MLIVTLLVVNNHPSLPWRLCLFSVKFLLLNHLHISCFCIFHHFCFCILVLMLVLPAHLCFSFSWHLWGKKVNRAEFLETVQPLEQQSTLWRIWGLGWFQDDFIFSLQPSFPLSDPSRVPGHTPVQIIRNSAGDVATFASADTTKPRPLVCGVFGQASD